MNFVHCEPYQIVRSNCQKQRAKLLFISKQGMICDPKGACSSVGSALRLYAERRAFDIFYAVQLFCAAR